MEAQPPGSTLSIPVGLTRDEAVHAFLSRPISIEAGAVRLRVPLRRIGVREIPQVTPPHPERSATSFRWKIDDTHLRSFVAHLYRLSYAAPEPGTLDFDTPNIRPPRPGVQLDRVFAENALREAALAGKRHIQLATQAVHPHDTPFVPKGLSSEQVLGVYETAFERYGDYLNRAHNVRIAAGRLHRTIIPAQATFSFNDKVGPRTPANGFREATVIYRGELTEDVGGGVCQAASTLHAAAFFAGLERVQHRPHSRPAAYVPMGLDATVVWPHTDLVLRNPYPFPIAVRSVVEGHTHRVELLGPRKPRTVSFEREWLGTRPFGVRRIPKPDGPRGSLEVLQRGVLGYTVRVLRTIQEGHERWTEENTFVYPPATQVVRVGPPSD